MAELNTVKAYIKGVDLAPRKVSIVASLVYGRSVTDALVILSHTPRRAAKPVAKAIESARANAINNHNLDSKTLVVKTLSVTVGERYKRYRPSTKGRALPYQKKSSNILVELTGKQKPKKAAAKKVESTTKVTSKKEDK